MKYLIHTLIVICLITFYSCKKAAKDEDWGESKIYIAQAGFDDGRQSNNYNLSINNKRLTDTSVVIGVYRSGLAALEAYSVNFELATDTLTKAINYANTPEGANNPKFEIYKDCKLLPADCFTIPTDIKIPDGSREATGKITINRAKLFANLDPISTKYIIPIRLKSPSKYQLHESLSMVMVVITRVNN